MALAPGDLEDVVSLEAAGVGHDVVFSVQLAGVDPADPDAEQRQADNIATAAKRAGVRQIVHTSVSGTGWRNQHPGYGQSDLFTAYWNGKEAAEEAVRRAGIDRWTIFKPAYYMDNWLPGLREDMYPELHQLPEGRLTTSDGPRTVLPVINAEDFGAAVAAAMSDPDRFHEAEIELAGDALTFPEVAAILSRAANRKITAVFTTPQDWEQVTGSPQAGPRTWDDLVGYPARPRHAAHYGLSTTAVEQWAARQDWRIRADAA